MKNLIKLICIIVMSFSGLTFGQDRPILSTAAEKLYNSETFKSFVIYDYNLLFERNVDKEFVLKLQKDNSILDDKSLNDAAIKLGFKSIEDMSSSYKKLYEIKNEFEKEFTLKDIDNEDLKMAAAEVIFDYLEKQAQTNAKNPKCWRVYKRCIAIATGTGYGIHVGCLGVDWSVFGGIVCHGAAFGTAWLMMESCEDDYIDCK